MHPKTAKNPRGAGRPTKYRTEEERRAAHSVANKRYNAKRPGRRRVVTHVDDEQEARLQAIMAREGLPSMAAAVRWLIGNLPLTIDN